MALLMPSSGISSFSCRMREIPAEISPRNRNFRVWVCSSVRDLEEGATDVVKLRSNCYDDLGWLYGKFSAPVKPTGTALFSAKKVMDEEERKQNYYVNTGYAIRTLREEFPELFHRELSFDIYRDDIVFKDPLNSFVAIYNITFTPHILIGTLEPGLHKLLKSILLGNVRAYALGNL
ncbi:unnamed protein product [Fraxinus pennsylvanica]|uniref:Uncharacterized protein n=1 Tax=Fraxinus pennsylvanica TaxID=56036 RepID=A0AAD2DVC2_9LAMI|nr:unnamed protein product [Fraxinus pennsylvanica]